MSQQQSYCSVCDHAVVPGVACDGQPEECPYHPTHSKQAHHEARFAETVDSMTGEKDTDSVRSLD